LTVRKEGRERKRSKDSLSRRKEKKTKKRSNQQKTSLRQKKAAFMRQASEETRIDVNKEKILKNSLKKQQVKKKERRN